MRTLPPKLATRAFEVARSLWFVPLVIALVGVALGVVLPFVDGLSGVRGFLAAHATWTRVLLASTADGARQLLGTSAGALATILGVAFSLTLVALQLAAQQYTPRVIGRLVDDRITKVVLGSYLGTVAYLLLVLRVVHGSDQEFDAFVPWVSITVGVILILCCLALLAAFVSHLASSMQATSIVTRVAADAIRRIRAGQARGPTEAQPGVPNGEPVWLEAEEHGYVQLVDVDEIARAAPRGSTFLLVTIPAGDFVFAGQRVAAVWPARPLEHAEIDRLREAFKTGSARTPDQDLMLAARQIADVTLKALSPAVNDETTAIEGVNELGAIGVDLARAGVPDEGYRRAERDGVVVVAPLLGMRQFVDEAFRDVIRNARAHPRVLTRIVDVVGHILAATPRDDARSAVLAAVPWVSEALRDAPGSGRAHVERRLASLREVRAGSPDPAIAGR